MIILWGLPGDDPLTMVHGALLRRGAPVLFIDQRKILQTQVELRVGENNSADVAGYINVHGQRTSLEAISAAYLRPYSVRQLPAIAQADPRSYAWKHASMVSDLLSSWIDLTPARVVNRPEAMATNSSKPYQATWIQSAGFAVPETIMTTDPQKAYAFWQKHKKIIYKSISGVRSIVSRLSEDQRERLEHVRWCPTQFQQYIPGIEYRVHVVGPEIFACRIISQADDYRYATRKQETVMMEACTIPEEIATRCQRLAHDLGLLVAGLDLRCTPQGTWYCFEANPSPGFVYFERATGLPIADAIARLLMMGADSG